jgi:hypothetical protein
VRRHDSGAFVLLPEYGQLIFSHGLLLYGDGLDMMTPRCQVKFCGIRGKAAAWWYWTPANVPEFVGLDVVDKKPAKSAVLCCGGCKAIIEQNYWRAKAG